MLTEREAYEAAAQVADAWFDEWYRRLEWDKPDHINRRVDCGNLMAAAVIADRIRALANPSDGSP